MIFFAVNSDIFPIRITTIAIGFIESAVGKKNFQAGTQTANASYEKNQSSERRKKFRQGVNQNAKTNQHQPRNGYSRSQSS